MLSFPPKNDELFWVVPQFRIAVYTSYVHLVIPKKLVAIMSEFLPKIEMKTNIIPPTICISWISVIKIMTTRGDFHPVRVAAYLYHDDDNEHDNVGKKEGKKKQKSFSLCTCSLSSSLLSSPCLCVCVCVCVRARAHKFKEGSTVSKS